MSVTVEITGKEIYDALLDVRKDVQELVGKVDSMPTRITDHETRLRYLEKAMWIYTGAAAVGGGAITQIVAAIITKG